MKKILVTGVANERSIAWAIAQKLHSKGYDIKLTYGHPNLEKRVKPLAQEIGDEDPLYFNVLEEDSVENLKSYLNGLKGESVHGIVHSMAYAPREALKDGFSQTTKDAYMETLEVSSYSLNLLSQLVLPYLDEYSSIVALSYYGAQKVIPNYNVMGVAKAALEAGVRYLAADVGAIKKTRVNAISAGPIKTLAASGISGFRDLLNRSADLAPLRENISAEDVANLASFLMSDESKMITGQTLFVDAGLSILGGVYG